jgi:hypothetical protein
VRRESEQLRRIHREVGELPWERIQQHLWEEIRELIPSQVQWQIRDRVCDELLNVVISPTRGELRHHVWTQSEERRNGH